MADPFRTSYYDTEATAYDDSRGGVERARAAAAAVLTLVPASGSCVDVAGGTGSVSVELAVAGLDVLVLDRSVGMLAVAARRLPGRVLAGEADRLPLAGASVDLVTMIWFLHLVPVSVADAALVEAVRVLRPGGHLVTTVDKDLAHHATRTSDSDAADRLLRVTDRVGLAPAGATSFRGDTVWGTAPGAGHQEFRVCAFRRR